MSTVLADLLDDAPFSRQQLLVCTLATLVIVLDGLNMQMLAFAGPLIIKDWSIAKVDFGAAVSAALLGMAVGTFAGGPLGDRFGRRPALIWAVVLFGLTTLTCAFARDVESLLLLRLIGGLGFGACFPNATSLVSEWTSRRHRAVAIGVMTVGVPLGGMAGALVALIAIPVGGWRACFLMAGVLALLLGLILVVALPESIEWLSRKTHRRAELEALLGRMQLKTFLLPTTVTMMADSAKSNGVLIRANLRTNFGLWLAFFANMLTGFGVVSWTTVILSAIGVPLTIAVGAAFPSSLASIALALGASSLVARFGSRRALTVLASVGAVAAIGLAALLATRDQASLTTAAILAIALIGACISGIQTLLFVLAANGFSVACRATGVGISVAWGRVGAVVGAFGGGLILSTASPVTFFLLSAAGLALAALGGLVVDRHVMPRGQARA